MSELKQAGKCVLAIDLGTGGPKVGLVDEHARVISSRSATLQVLFLPDGGAEHDPAEWWSTITRCVREVLQESGLSPGEIVAVAVTSMWSVTTPVDEQAQPLMNAMSWMDGRGAPYNRRIMGGFPNVQGYQLTRLLKYLDICGFPPTLKGADALGHILFIKNERPEIYRRTYKFLEPSDFINFRLTGICAATQNTAMPLLMIDNRRLDRTDYHPWLVKMGGVDREKLPDLIPHRQPARHAAALGRRRMGSGSRHPGGQRHQRQQLVSHRRRRHPAGRDRRRAGHFRLPGHPCALQKDRYRLLDGHHALRAQGQLPVLGRAEQQRQGARIVPDQPGLCAGSH